MPLLCLLLLNLVLCVFVAAVVWCAVDVRLYVFDGFAAGCVRCCCCLRLLLMLAAVDVLLLLFAFVVDVGGGGVLRWLLGFIVVGFPACVRCCLRMCLMWVLVVVVS